ncbi:MAG TPA: pyruvate dehydrogenase complex dihydrolipoamide acetyltransferase [Cyclobacteriaceae bacterium]|nr:pyruvate dehydrogenase complex dihydrolipoamide acetyltransferase [Cyclobacteriaceae bacterium]
MAEIIRMPRMSDTMEEGVIAKWLKKVGDAVKSGDTLAEVETDKATMELESYQDGVILYLGVEEKQSVPVNGVLAIIGKKGEKIDELIDQVKNEPAKGSSDSEQPAEKIASVKETMTPVSGIKATVISMPRMSDTMTEGTITKWIKKPGEKVKSGDVLAEVETDKATMELEAFDNGELLYIAVKEGESVAVDDVIAVIGEKNADYMTLVKDFNSRHKSPAAVEVKKPTMPEKSAKPLASSVTVPVADVKKVVKESNSGISTDGRIKASPLAKKLAREHGFDLSGISGTGENGRIVRRDIESYMESGQSGAVGVSQFNYHYAQVTGKESFSEVPVSQMRKTIAKRLAESKFTAPHFYLTMEINMDQAIGARNSVNEEAPSKISFNDLILKACARALRKNPRVNSSWLGDRIRYNEHIHIGVAVAVEDGLIVPVIRHADLKSVYQIAAEVKDLSQKARNKQLQPKDWEGNTFTISNLGMFGIEEFTAIINPPDACILAVGGIKQTPIVRDGQVVAGNVMKVSLSCDHRVVDGATGATFLQSLKNILENPVKIFI